MGIVLDLILVAIIFVFVSLSAKKGFVAVAVETAGFIAAIILAFAISTPLANLTYDKLIEAPMVKGVEEAVGNAADIGTEELKSKMPKFILEDGKFGISAEKFNDTISQNMGKGATEAVKTASQTVIKPVVARIISMVYSIAIFLILLFVVRFLAKLLNKLFSFSVVGKLNRTLGGIVGLFKGGVIAILFCVVISIIISFTNGGFLIFTPENIAKSYVFKFFTNIIPF